MLIIFYFKKIVSIFAHIFKQITITNSFIYYGLRN